MKHIKEILRPAINSLFWRWQAWRMQRRALRLTNPFRYWRVGTTFSGVIDLGFMSRDQALEQIKKLGLGKIIHIDNEIGFIAIDGNPKNEL